LQNFFDWGVNGQRWYKNPPAFAFNACFANCMFFLLSLLFAYPLSANFFVCIAWGFLGFLLNYLMFSLTPEVYTAFIFAPYLPYWR